MQIRAPAGLSGRTHPGRRARERGGRFTQLLVADVRQPAQVWRCFFPPVRAAPGIAENKRVHPWLVRRLATYLKRSDRR